MEAPKFGGALYVWHHGVLDSQEAELGVVGAAPQNMGLSFSLPRERRGTHFPPLKSRQRKLPAYCSAEQKNR